MFHTVSSHRPGPARIGTDSRPSNANRVAVPPRRKPFGPLSVLLALSLTAPVAAKDGPNFGLGTKSASEDSQTERPAGTAVCTDLPPSTLEIYDIRPASLERVVLDVPNLRAHQNDPKLIMGHIQATMAMGGELAILMNVEHRLIASPNVGGYCDSPSKVRVGVGYASRQIYMTRTAAEDSCVRDALMEHAQKHIQAEEVLLARFLVSERTWFGRKLGELKQIPASTSDEAQKQFTAGTLMVTRDARQRFLDARAAQETALDHPSELARLNAACDGKVGQLEKQAGQPI